MSFDYPEASVDRSVLEDPKLDYRRIGFNRNPFESMPVFSELQPIPFNGYLKHYLYRLSSIVNHAVVSRPASVYLVGMPGSGKSAILRTLCQMSQTRGRVLPIYTRFPLSGGRTAFYNELLRRLPIPLLELVFYYAKGNYSKVARTYFGRKLVEASTCKDLWNLLGRMRISPQYTIESISDILSIILDISESTRIALILDEFEHAWARFSGAQKYNWEKSIVDIILQLGQRLVLVLPALPDSVTMGSRPYLNMHDWKGIDLDCILKATKTNTLEINCSQATLKECIYSILRHNVISKRGENTCETLLSGCGTYTTIGEAITDLRGMVLTMVNEGRSWVRDLRNGLQ